MDSLPITQSTSDDLMSIATLGLEKLSRLVENLGDAPEYVPSKALVSKFGEVVGSDMGRLLLRHVASLNLLRDEEGDSAEAVFEALYNGIVDAGYDDLEEKIALVRDPLTALISNEAVYLSVKGARLFSVDSLHMHDFKIYCDLRPVFGPHRSRVHAMMMFASLNITASDDSETEEKFSLSLRHDDLHEIIDECKKALEKLDELEATVSKLEGVGVIRYGRD